MDNNFQNHDTAIFFLFTHGQDTLQMIATIGKPRLGYIHKMLSRT